MTRLLGFPKPCVSMGGWWHPRAAGRLKGDSGSHTHSHGHMCTLSTPTHLLSLTATHTRTHTHALCTHTHARSPTCTLTVLHCALKHLHACSPTHACAHTLMLSVALALPAERPFAAQQPQTEVWVSLLFLSQLQAAWCQAGPFSSSLPPWPPGVCACSHGRPRPGGGLCTSWAEGVGWMFSAHWVSPGYRRLPSMAEEGCDQALHGL